jgi:hypothetical protein
MEYLPSVRKLTEEEAGAITHKAQESREQIAAQYDELLAECHPGDDVEIELEPHEVRRTVMARLRAAAGRRSPALRLEFVTSKEPLIVHFQVFSTIEEPAEAPAPPPQPAEPEYIDELQPASAHHDARRASPRPGRSGRGYQAGRPRSNGRPFQQGDSQRRGQQTRSGSQRRGQQTRGDGQRSGSPRPDGQRPDGQRGTFARSDERRNGPQRDGRGPRRDKRSNSGSSGTAQNNSYNSNGPRRSSQRPSGPGNGKTRRKW